MKLRGRASDDARERKREAHRDPQQKKTARAGKGCWGRWEGNGIER